ncbi:MAG: cobyrinate a,c-diamide synthase [Chloroflexi bacterium]|nr:cobyrinate a,c-diamide synthase [Chloroflexota bacterium]
MKAVVIAGAASGAGKTTIATGIMASLAHQGLKVQPFKAGPDYIDPTYHTWAAGRPSRNLDTWMLPACTVVELFRRAMSGKDIGVIEGVMGLFDGRSATSDEGSTAGLAKLLGAPVLLVLDARKAARSLAAMVTGFRDFDAGLRLAGVILNGIGSDRHYDLCREAIEHYTRVPVLGYLPRRDNLSLPERHLGLVPTVEGPAGADFLSGLREQCRATIDLELLISISETATVPQVKPEAFPQAPRSPSVRIAVARDRAFSFYYQDSLDLLEAWGAELTPFSPLADDSLPGGAAGLYIGGGFPEVYAGELSRNEFMKQAIKAAASQGMPLYAECGGLMYLGEGIRDMAGTRHSMTGVIPVSTRIDSPRLSLGYRTVEALGDGPLLRRGETVRGHEFHWSVLESDITGSSAYRVQENARLEGFHRGNLLASYIHLHLASAPGMAQRFVESCRRFKLSATSPA